MKKNIKFIKIPKDRSFYYKEIQNIWLSENTDNKRTIHRLCNLMRKMQASTLVKEKILNPQNYIKKEIEALKKYFSEKIDFEIYKVDFFENPAFSPREINNNPAISSSVIINFKANGKWNSYIFYSVVALPFIRIEDKNKEKIGLLNNYIHNFGEFACYLDFGKEGVFKYKIEGTFYCQQNGVTSVCSHAAICMSINNFPQKHKDEIDEKYRDKLIFPEDLNEILEIDHEEEKINLNRKIRSTDFEKILSGFGFKTYTVNFVGKNKIKEKYSEHLYRYMESQCPSLLIFSSKEDNKSNKIKDEGKSEKNNVQHIVPILGHTLNTDLWRPEAEIVYDKICGDLVYRSSSAWVDHLIISDDNFGMYYCLPVDSLHKTRPMKDDPSFRALSCISIIPKDIEVPGQLSEMGCLIFFQTIFEHLKSEKKSEENFWINELINSLLIKRDDSAFNENTDPPKTPFVVRTLLVTKSDYQENMNNADFNGNSLSESEKEILFRGLPDIFWLSEITLPDLYTTNKHKLADFLFSAHTNGHVIKNDDDLFRYFIKARLPGVLFESQPNGEFETNIMSIDSHLSLIRHQGEDDPMEW